MHSLLCKCIRWLRSALFAYLHSIFLDHQPILNVHYPKQLKAESRIPHDFVLRRQFGGVKQFIIFSKYSKGIICERKGSIEKKNSKHGSIATLLYSCVGSFISGCFVFVCFSSLFLLVSWKPVLFLGTFI